MKLRSRVCILALVLYTSSLSLAFGAPAPPTSPPPRAASPGVANDGYSLTALYFQAMKNKAVEIEGVLKTAQEQSAGAAPGDTAKQRALFLQKLEKQYPGVTFDGSNGSVPFQKNFVALFNSALKIECIRETGFVTLDYLVNQGKIQLTEGANSVAIIVDLTDPSRSSFVNVIIPAMKEAAEKIVIDPDRKRIAADTAGAAVLNDAYQLLSLTNTTRMDIFVVDILSNPSAQQNALSVAASGYLERHALDYQAAAPGQKKKQVATRSNKFDDKRFYEDLLKILILIVALSATLCVLIVGIRRLKARSTKNAQRGKKAKREDRIRSHSPMVTRALNDLGRSLWGRNLPWARNYYIYERSERWILCDGMEDKKKKIFKARTRIEVSLRSAYFRLKITRLKGVAANVWLDCHDFSKRELVDGLRELGNELTNPTGRYDHVEGRDAEEVDRGSGEPEEPAAGSPPAVTEPVPETTPPPAEDEAPDVMLPVEAQPSDHAGPRHEELPASPSEAAETIPAGSSPPDEVPAAALPAAEEEPVAAVTGESSANQAAAPQRKRPPTRTMLHPVYSKRR